MKAPSRVRRNTSALPPITPADYPSVQSSPADWEREAARKRKHTLERQLINNGKRINDLCVICRLMDDKIRQLTKRLKFVENATKLTVGPHD